MDKNRFTYLVSHYNSLDQKETGELRLEQDRFGYCQVLHQLIARGDQDNQTEMREQSLNVAAVYATDRSVLKKIMTEPRAERKEIYDSTPEESANATSESEAVEHAKLEEVTIAEVEPIIQKEPENQDLRVKLPESDSSFDPEVALSEFISELEPMRRNKLLFEKAVQEFENKSHPVVDEEKPKRRGRPKSQHPEEPIENTSDKLLDEIKTSKKKIVSDNPKQKEQTEIIDQFIKSKPTISKPTANQDQLDLTEPNESYNENVVSETLALILIKQGKKEKAVEVLRKLIWKFPQKKAYFAAQIEDLIK